MLLKHGGPFCKFLSCLLSAENRPAPTSSTWPMPLPYPGVFKAKQPTRPSWRHKRINLIVAQLDWLHLGCPASPPPGLGLGARLSASQRRAVAALERLVEDSTTFFKLDPSLMGRSAVKAEDQHKTLAALSRAMGGFEGDIGYFPKIRHEFRSDESNHDGSNGFKTESNGKAAPLDSVTMSPCRKASRRPDFGRVQGKIKLEEACSAKPIQAARIKFPPPPSFCPKGFLDRATQELFDRPLDFERPPDPTKIIPVVKVRANRAEKLQLYRALAASGRLKPVRVEASRLPFAGGMFSVPKDLERDRLVLDARPGNSLTDPPSYWSATMASASVLLPMILNPSEELRISSADLKDYFYLFQVTDQRLTKNLLQGTLTTQECEEVFGHPCSDFAEEDGTVRVALATLAMGDNAAVEFAQGSHLGVLYRNGIVSPEELLVPNFPPPRGLLSIGVVLDDLVILERVARNFGMAAEMRKAAGGERLDAAHACYASVGLLAHPEKGYRDADEATFWGVKLNGKSGLLRPSPSRLGPLTLITARVASLGICTKALLQSLVGSWTSVFLLRRRALSLLQICFEALTRTEDDDIIRLSPGLRDEMWSWVLLGPVCVADLRAQVLEAAFATDASDDMIAAVRADVPAEFAAEVFQHSLQKGAWARLLSGPQAWFREKGLLCESQELPGEEAFTPHPLWRVLARSLNYQKVFASRVRATTHINLKELHAFLRLEERIGDRMVNVRFVCALDSRLDKRPSRVPSS